MFPPHSTLDAEGMVHFHQVLLGGHDGIDVLVGHRDPVDHVFLGLDPIGHRVQLLGLGAAPHAARAVAAAFKALGVVQAAQDVDARLAAPGALCTLAGDEYILAKGTLLLRIVVVAVHGLRMAWKGLASTWRAVASGWPSSLSV